MKKIINWDCSRAVILKLEGASESPGGFVKTQIARPIP